MGDKAKIAKDTEYVKELPGFKRTKPNYFSDPVVDRLMEVVLMMGGEIWSLRHRQAITEKLMAQGKPVSPDIIETFEADEDFRGQLETERQDFIRRIFAALAEGEFPDPREEGFKWVTRPVDEENEASGAA